MIPTKFSVSANLFSRLLAAALIIGFGNSCSDDPPAGSDTYNAILVDAATGNPIPNRKVYALSQPVRVIGEFNFYSRHLLLPNTPLFAIDSTITNSVGRFSFPADLIGPRDPINAITLGTQENIFIYRNVPFYRVTDTFYTEPTRRLNIQMQKSTAAHPSDTLMETISLYKNGNWQWATTDLRAQTGISNFSIEIPYSQNFADKAVVQWTYRGDLPSKTGADTILLNPTANTSYQLNY